MRRLLCIVLASCGEVLDVTVPADAPSPDAAALLPIPCRVGTPGAVDALPLGISYVPSLDRMTIAKIYADSVWVKELDQGVFSEVLMPTAGVSAYSRSTLDPGGQQVFVHARLEDGTFEIRRATRQAMDLWTVEATLSVEGAGVQIPITASAYPSAPTATSPRRMVLVLPDEIIEIEEGADDSWSAIGSTSVTQLGVSSVLEAHLDPSGARLVFHGASSGDSVHRVFYADRISFDHPFSAASVLFEHTAPPVTPYFTNDCKELYFTTTSNNAVNLVPFTSGDQQ